MQSFPVLTRTRNILRKPLFHGVTCFRRISRRRIASSSTLLSSAFVDFLENQQCVAIMEGQPWVAMPPKQSSASKKMMTLARQKSNEHTGNDKPFLKNSMYTVNDDYINRQRNDDAIQLQVSPEKKYILRLKGHTTPRCGGAGIGLILEDSVANERIWSARLYVSGDRTPFEAEYSAIILGMDYALNMFKVRQLTILSSNDIIVNQVQGNYAVTKSSLEILLKTIKSIQRRLCYFAIEQIPSEDNSEATNQAMKALATRKSLNIKDEDWKVERRDPIQKLHRNPLKMGRWRKPDDPAQSTIIDPSRIYRLQFDGGAREHVGAGMVLYDDDGTEIWCGWHFHPGVVNNNIAEYMALICGLRCSQSLGVKKLIVEGDSLLVVRQMIGNYRTRERDLDLFREEAYDLIKDLSYFQIRYIPRSENRRADWLANHAMNLQESDGFMRIDET